MPAPYRGPTLWGIPVVEVLEPVTPRVSFGTLEDLLDTAPTLTIHKKCFRNAATTPEVGMKFTIENHPLFKDREFTIRGIQDSEKDSDFVQIVFTEETKP